MVSVSHPIVRSPDKREVGGSTLPRPINKLARHWRASLLSVPSDSCLSPWTSDGLPAVGRTRRARYRRLCCPEATRELQILAFFRRRAVSRVLVARADGVQCPRAGENRR